MCTGVSPILFNYSYVDNSLIGFYSLAFMNEIDNSNG